MRTIMVDVEVFERGDKVTTPEGAGIVLADEVVLDFNPYNRKVIIKLVEKTPKFLNGILEVSGENILLT